MECKDLDKITSRGDICAALKEQLNLNDIGQIAVKRIGGAQTGIISLPGKLSVKLNTASKIRIG